jgi:hypothetical protein
MADYVNPLTGALVASVNDMPAPWQACTRLEFEEWSAIPARFRKWGDGAIVEMSAAEKFPSLALYRIR